MILLFVGHQVRIMISYQSYDNYYEDEEPSNLHTCIVISLKLLSNTSCSQIKYMHAIVHYVSSQTNIKFVPDHDEST